MKNKLLTHIVFFLILEIIYILSHGMIYISESLVWNLILASILFCINLINNRRYKWISIALFCILHFVFTIFGADAPEGNMIYLLEVAARVNIPFLPSFELGFESRFINEVIYYVMFFYGPLLYWYGVYQASKKIVVKFRPNQ